MRGLAGQIAEAVTKSGLSQSALIEAAGLGISQPSLSRRLSGRTPFSALEIEKIAEAIGLTIKIGRRR